MALLGNNINDVTKLIHYGNRGDICILCRRELATKNPSYSLPDIDRQLLGKLEGKKVFKTRHSGADLVICMDHIRKIAAEDGTVKSGSNKKKEES